MNKNIFNILVSALMALSTIELQALTTQGNQIIDSSGNPVELKGLNWFGFNNQSTMVDGLWGNDMMKDDFQTVVHRMKLLGFNAVRLPFSFKDLLDLQPKNYSKKCSAVTTAQIQANVTNPSYPVEPGKTIPPLPAPVSSSDTSCNDYLPNDSTFNRYVWVVDYLAKNGFYVLIDNHLREDSTALDNKDDWAQKWAELASAVYQNPASRDKVMFDILNEPDNYGIRWEKTSDRLALGDYYLSAMDAIYQVNPDALFLIEGTGQGGIDTNWGDGFATDPALISQYGLSDPNPFFKELMKKPYVNQVVISPHVYPPSVTHASKNYSGAGLANRLTSSFGYLTEKGYCTETECKQFPVAVGEFGSRFDDQKDIESMNDIAAYLNNTGQMADGKHAAITNWFYWSWNANSGDTGGLVDNGWINVEWKKIDYLMTLALNPWYLNPADVVTPTEPPIETTPPPVETTPPPVEEHPGIPPSSETSGGQFTVKAEPGSAWLEKPGVYNNVINLFITNNSDKEISVPWTIELSNSAYTGVVSYWNLDVTSSSGGTIVGNTTENWQTLMPNGKNSVNVGIIVSSTSQNFTPQSIKINGQNASVR